MTLGKTKLVISFIIFIIMIRQFMPFNAFAQGRVYKYPVRFSQYYNCLTLINPASAGTSGHYELFMGNQRLVGNFGNVSTYFINANMRIFTSSDENRPYSTIGVLLCNDREGKYLNRTRYYAVYSWHGSITKNLKVSGGFQLGALSYLVKGTELSGDGSDIKADGGVGVQVYNDKFVAGLTLNQIFNSEVQPLEEVTILAPYFNLHAGYNYAFYDFIKFHPSFSIQIPLNSKSSIGSDQLIDVNLGFLIHKINLSLGLYNNRRMSASVGLSNMVLAEGTYRIHLSYVFPVAGKNTINISLFELGLGFIF